MVVKKKSLKALVLSLLRSYFALHLARLLVPSLVCSESCTIGSCSKAVDSLKDESTFSIRGILLMKDLRGAAGYQKKTAHRVYEMNDSKQPSDYEK